MKIRDGDVEFGYLFETDKTKLISERRGVDGMYA